MCDPINITGIKEVSLDVFSLEESSSPLIPFNMISQSYYKKVKCGKI